MCQKLDFYAVLATYSLDQLSLPRKGLKSIVSPAIKLGVSPSLSPGQVILNPEQMQTESNSLSWKRNGSIRDAQFLFCFTL